MKHRCAHIGVCTVDDMEVEVAKTAFRKRYSRGKTFQSGDLSSQTYYITVQRTDRKRVKDVRCYTDNCI